MGKIRKSEYRSYAWIRNELQKAGWNTKNPATETAGEVYYQQECLNHPEIEKVLGKKRPEFVVKLNDSDYWIIEAKGDVDDLDEAFKEAKEYGRDFNRSSVLTAKIITGVAGADGKEMRVRTALLTDGEYKVVTYNGEEITSILTKERAEQLLRINAAELQDLIPDEKVLVAVAEDINEVLHEASINKSARSQVVSALILAMLEPGNMEIKADCQVFIDSINSKVRQALKKYGKEDFSKSINLILPEKENAQKKYKNALIQTYHLLQKIDIKAAMCSRTDVLGKFYEVFLKYGNGAKDIGIVLTPRHIAKFACGVMDIKYTDIVYDPTCGTGGFLVAAFDYVRENAAKDQVGEFKDYRIFGIEQDPAVATMAIVNMIFRGDGKSNIINEDCFPIHIEGFTTQEGVKSAKYAENVKDGKQDGKVVTKVLMNPPFSKKSEKEREYRFIQHALNQMEDGGILFAIVPTSVMIKTGKVREWREKLLNENTLLSVISFPEDLFYPVGIRTAGIFVKKGKKHNYEKDRILWARVQNDGFVKSKGKRLFDSRAKNELQDIQRDLKMHLYDTELIEKNTPERVKVCLLGKGNDNLELMPEIYLEEKQDTQQQMLFQIENYLREYLAYLIKKGVKLDISVENQKREKILPEMGRFENIALKDFLREDVRKGSVHSISEVSEGSIPLISCKSDDNGIVGLYDMEEAKCVSHCLSVAGDGSFPLTAYYHYEKVDSYDNVSLLPLRYDLKPETIFFLASRLNRSRWRYSYGRKCYPEKVKELSVCLPVDDNGKLDEGFMKEMFSQIYGWDEISKYIMDHLGG